jgi:hypothetical protein
VAGSPLPRRLLVATLLGLAVAGVFWPILGHDFTNYDDDEYLTGNTWVQQGITPESLAWAWTSGHIYWQPLTWMSHMLDWELFGADATGHHAVSLAYHVANTSARRGRPGGARSSPRSSASIRSASSRSRGPPS